MDNKVFHLNLCNRLAFKRCVALNIILVLSTQAKASLFESKRLWLSHDARSRLRTAQRITIRDSFAIIDKDSDEFCFLAKSGFLPLNESKD